MSLKTKQSVDTRLFVVGRNVEPVTIRKIKPEMGGSKVWWIKSVIPDIRAELCERGTLALRVHFQWRGLYCKRPLNRGPQKFLPTLHGRIPRPTTYFIAGCGGHHFNSEHRSLTSRLSHTSPHKGYHGHLSACLHNSRNGGLLCSRYKGPSTPALNWWLGGTTYDSQLDSLGWKWVWLFCPSTHLFREIQV